VLKCPKFEKHCLLVHSVLNKFWWSMNFARVKRKEELTCMCYFYESGLSLYSVCIYRVILNPVADRIRGLSNHGTFSIVESLLG
jgi:hypothetical protein